MTTLDADMVEFIRNEMGEEHLNRHLTHQSKAVFAAKAAEAVGKGTVHTLHEHVSRTMFGNAKRLDAGIWIANLNDRDAETFWAAQYQEWCRLNGRRWPGDIGAEIRRFETLGMVEEVSRNRCVIYRRLPSPMWDVFIMCDVVIAESVGERKYYQPSSARTAQMINELLEIRADTGGPPIPTAVEPEEAELRRQKNKAKAAAEARRRPRGPNGEFQCSKCLEWKIPDLFSRRPGSGWQYKSWCKLCMARKARARYLSLKKEAALNMVGLAFIVTEQDDVVGLSCAACGQVIEEGDRVHADARLVHEACMT